MLDTVSLCEPCGKLADSVGGRAGRVGFRPRHDDVGIGECRPLLGQSLWPEQAPGDPKQLVGVGLAVPDAPEQRAQLARPEAMFGCPRSPVLA